MTTSVLSAPARTAAGQPPRAKSTRAPLTRPGERPSSSCDLSANRTAEASMSLRKTCRAPASAAAIPAIPRPVPSSSTRRPRTISGSALNLVASARPAGHRSPAGQRVSRETGAWRRTAPSSPPNATRSTWRASVLSAVCISSISVARRSVLGRSLFVLPKLSARLVPSAVISVNSLTMVSLPGEFSLESAPGALKSEPIIKRAKPIF